jgi:hypothetical protein
VSRGGGEKSGQRETREPETKNGVHAGRACRDWRESASFALRSLRSELRRGAWVESKRARTDGKREEAHGAQARHAVRMNYNNFICRIAAPRPANLVSEKAPAPATPKKSRKSVRRRLAAGIAAMVLACGGASGHAVEDLRVVPASGTVMFAEGVSGADFFTEPSEDTVPSLHEVLAERVEAVASAARPAPAHASALTVVLICAGLGVAFIQSTRLFRTDFTC